MANETETGGAERGVPWNDEEMKILRRQMEARQAAFRIEMAAIAEIQRYIYDCEIAMCVQATKKMGGSDAC